MKGSFLRDLGQVNFVLKGVKDEAFIFTDYDSYNVGH